MKRTRRLIFQLGIIMILMICIFIFFSYGPGERVVVETSGNMPLVYFCPSDDCMGVLINLTRQAANIDCAFYDLDLQPLIDTFMEKKSGSRLVLDYKNYHDNEDRLAGISDLIKVAIPNHQMHNKFCIFDGNIVATGSFNPTERGNFYNNNNLVVLHSEYLARNYEDEFDELWKGVYSGGKKTRYPLVRLNGDLIENFFCPDDCSPEIYTDLVGNAEESVYFMTFSFTHDDIGDALIDAHGRGIVVKGVFEKSQNNQWNEFERLKVAGIDVMWDENPANMHHKVFMIDGKTVITGSANPSNNGLNENDENIIVLHDNLVAAQFLEEFYQVNNQNLNI